VTLPLHIHPCWSIVVAGQNLHGWSSRWAAYIFMRSMELILNITLFEFKATKITYSNPQTQKNDLKWNGGIFVICKQMLHG